MAATNSVGIDTQEERLDTGTGGELERSFAYLEELYRRPIVPPREAKLRRIATLLSQFGDPHNAFPSVHVTGTCGKGSTATMIAQGLQAAGYRTGIFRSPHLDSYRERIAVNEQIIPEEAWLDTFNRVRTVSEDMEAGRVSGYDLGRISLFEMVWAMAAIHFAEVKVDIAVVEVGIGGRLSPTNVLEPEVAVVTNISLDHTSFLGPTERDIAREKAQIIKRGSASVTGATQADAIEEIEKQAADTRSPLWIVGRDVVAEVSRHDMGGERVTVTTPVRQYRDLEVGLLGEHQALNAAAAVAALDHLRTRGMAIPSAAVNAGLAQARLPGRFEVIDGSPIVVLDGARNVASATVLRHTIRDLFPGRAVTLLIGVLQDKDAAGIVDVLAPEAQRAVVTTPPWEGRSGHIERVESALRTHLADVTVISDVAEALRESLSRTEPSGLLLVAGSMYLVAAIRGMLSPSGVAAR